ncbi:Fidgetin protein 1 [Pelomyxa schiedti]|nr:Fidgetin protein 1 [Pelomyxa schiedti]
MSSGWSDLGHFESAYFDATNDGPGNDVTARYHAHLRLLSHLCAEESQSQSQSHAQSRCHGFASRANEALYRVHDEVQGEISRMAPQLLSSLAGTCNSETIGGALDLGQLAAEDPISVSDDPEVVGYLNAWRQEQERCYSEVVRGVRSAKARNDPEEVKSHRSAVTSKEANPFITASEKMDIENKKKGKEPSSLGKRRPEPGRVDSEPPPKIPATGSTPASAVPSIVKKVTKKPPPSHDDDDESSCSITEVNGVPLEDPRLRNLEPRLIERIVNEILESAPTVTWGDIAGLEHAKTCIQEAVIWPILRPDIFVGNRQGLLHYSYLSDSFQTMIGKAIARECKSAFLNISASTLTSKWIGEGEKIVRSMFAVARCYDRSVIFIDEIDSILSARSESENEATRRLKTEFLIQLDGAGINPEEDHILVVGATNRPQELDDAARRRLVKRLYIPLPDVIARYTLLVLLLKTTEHSITEEQFHYLAQLTEGYSGSDIKALCQDAALGPIRKLQREKVAILNVDKHNVPPVTTADFEASLRQIRPSVAQDALNQYLEWNRQFGSFDEESTLSSSTDTSSSANTNTNTTSNMDTTTSTITTATWGDVNYT